MRKVSVVGRRSMAKVVLFGLVATLFGYVAPTTSSAAPGDAVPTLPAKTGLPGTVGGGDTVQYTINYTCSNNEGDVPPDGCDGTTFADPVPTFTNVYGEEMPLEFVSATGPASVWPGGFTLDSSDPANPVVRSTAGAWPPGASGSIFITLRVPVGMVPEGTQAVTNQATLDDPEGAPTQSPVATTQLVGAAPAWTVSKTGPATGTRMNRDHQWTVAVCGASDAALWPVFEITDTLPAGVQFVSAEGLGQFTDDGLTSGISDGDATVTWTFDSANRPPVGSDGCFRFRVTGRFPSSYVHPAPVDPANEHNVAGAVKTNVATGLGKTTPADEGVGLGTAPWDTTLVGPVFGSADTGKSFTDLAGNGSFYATAGETGRFNLSATVDSDFLLDAVTLTDGDWTFDGGAPAPGLPDSFTATALDPGTWNDPVTATILGSDDDFATSDVIASGVASGATNIVLGTAYRSFRWEWSNPGAIRGDFQATGLQIIGEIGTPEDDLGLYTNISTLDVFPDGSAPVTDQASDQYVLEDPLPHADVTKTVSNASRQPGQTTTFNVRVSNSGDATGALVDPVISDCVPDFLDVQPITLTGSWSTGPGLPTCGPGETPLRFTWSGTLQPGQQTTLISYTVLVAPSDPGPVAPYGTYQNTAVVSPTGGGAFAHCVDTNPACGARATVTVTPTVELTSQKCVRGELDAGIFRPTPRCTGGEPAVTPALTTPGGEITYRLDLNNTGNTDADGVDFIDIFPHVGDTAVISGSGGVLNPRNSEYAPILVAPITPPPGWTVAYSTSANPCRPEVGGPNNPGTTCEAPGWTTTPDLLALSSYQSVKLSHPGVLARGATASFAWAMRAPVLDPTYDQDGSDADDPYEHLHDCGALVGAGDPTHCPRAVNSFAYGANAANLPPGTPQPARLTAEPPQVEVRVMDPQFANRIGNRVWFDRDYDGLQDADTTPSGEPGIAGILVQLWTADGTTLLAETFTDAAGAYLFNSMDPDGDGVFEAIPDGDYTVRFYPPAGWYVSPPDVGDDADADSDLPRTPSGTDPTLGDYHETIAITLGDDPNVDLDGDEIFDGESDPTWDLGLWRAIPDVDIDKVTRDSSWPVDEAGDGVEIVQGRPVTWDYTITNTGNTRLQDVDVTDDGGPGAPFTVTACTIVDDGENADGQPSSAADPIALNRGAVMTCTATGTAGAVAYANNGTVTGLPALDDGTPVSDTPPGFPELPPVTDTDPSSYTSGAYDLALAKTVGAPDLGTGDVTYTLTVQNQGTVPSGAYTVTDELPAGMSFVSSTPAATTAAGATVTWDLGDLDPDETQTISVNAHIDDFLARPYRNHAEISADSAALVETGGVLTPTTDVDSTPEDDPTNVDDAYYGDVGEPTDADNATIDDAGVGPDVEDDEDIADLDPAVVYDLALAKVADATALTQDEDATIEYTITVANQGNVPSGSYTVTDTLAPGLTVVEPIPGGGVLAGDTITWAGTNLAPDEEATFTFEVVVSDLTLRPYRNVAEISDDSAQELYAVDDVDSAPNTDPSDDNDGNGVTEGNGYGPVGSPAPGGVDNITVADAGQGNDGEDDADIADVNLPLTDAYDIAVAKTVDAPTVAYDGTVTYTVTVQNQGLVDSREVEVIDIVPPGLTVVDPDGAVDNGDGTITWTIENLEPGETVTFTLTATVADVTERPYRNHAEISDDSADFYTVEGEAIEDVDSDPDADPDNDGDYGAIGSLGPVDNVGDDAILQAGVDDDPEDDADIADVTLVPITYDLALVKIGPATMDVDGTATFTVTVENQGNVPSGAYTVTDDVPAGMEATEASDGGVISGDGTEVVWTDLPSLDPGESTELTVTLQITDLTLRDYTNVAEITDDSADAYSTPDDPITDVDSVPDDEEDSDVDNTDIDEAGDGDDGGFDDEDIALVTTTVTYDLALAKTVDTDTIAYDGTATFTITIENQSNVPSGVITVTDTVPPGLEVGAISDGGVLADDGTTVTWELELAVGETAVRTFDVTVADITLRPYTNVAEITEDGADGYSTPEETITDVDSVPGDEEDSDVDNADIDEAGDGDDEGFDDEDVALLDSPVIYDLALVKRLLPDQRYRLGDVVDYEIEVTNEGNVPSGPYSVTDTLPAGMELASASHGGAAAGQVVTWTDLESLDPGDSVVLTVGARLADVTRDSYVNVAEVSDDSAEEYSTETEEVTDRDSRPGEVLGEDDEDRAELPVDQVRADNAERAPDLPRTGATVGGLLGLAALLLLTGIALRTRSRRGPGRHFAG